MFLFELLNLPQGFKRYFDVSPAVVDSLQDEAYGVRHKVYCEELGFEPVRKDRRERDEYDDRAVHVLVKSVRYARYAGCARIVRVDPGDPLSRLPVEKTCKYTIERGIVDPSRLPRERIGEISRLAVIPRRRVHAAGASSARKISTHQQPRSHVVVTTSAHAHRFDADGHLIRRKISHRAGAALPVSASVSATIVTRSPKPPQLGLRASHFFSSPRAPCRPQARSRGRLAGKPLSRLEDVALRLGASGRCRAPRPSRVPLGDDVGARRSNPRAALPRPRAAAVRDDLRSSRSSARRGSAKPRAGAPA